MKFNVSTIGSNGKFNESSFQGQRKKCSQTQRKRWVCCIQGREEGRVHVIQQREAERKSEMSLEK